MAKKRKDEGREVREQREWERLHDLKRPKSMQIRISEELEQKLRAAGRRQGDGYTTVAHKILIRWAAKSAVDKGDDGMG